MHQMNTELELHIVPLLIQTQKISLVHTAHEMLGLHYNCRDIKSNIACSCSSVKKSYKSYIEMQV
jgi:hypothetical protein